MGITQEAKAVAKPGYELREIRDGLYWICDGAYNTMFLVSTAGVIVVDPLPTLGERYLQAIRSVTAQPVTHIVYSHAHIDHIGGAGLLAPGATIIAQRETAEQLRTRRDPKRPIPSVVFDDRYALTVGDQLLELTYSGINHSAGNVFVHAPRQKVLMLVDVVYPGYMPYPELGVALDVDGYEAAIRQALRYDFKEFVGGHVDRLGTREDVQTALEFVVELRRVVAASLADLSFPAFLKRSPAQQSAWFAHDDYENNRLDVCMRQLMPVWAPRLRGADRFLRSHCRAMLVALEIDVLARSTSL